jgi:hypothetical protein
LSGVRAEFECIKNFPLRANLNTPLTPLKGGNVPLLGSDFDV